MLVKLLIKHTPPHHTEEVKKDYCSERLQPVCTGIHSSTLASFPGLLQATCTVTHSTNSGREPGNQAVLAHERERETSPGAAITGKAELPGRLEDLLWARSVPMGSSPSDPWDWGWESLVGGLPDSGVEKTPAGIIEPELDVGSCTAWR